MMGIVFPVSNYLPYVQVSEYPQIVGFESFSEYVVYQVDLQDVLNFIYGYNVEYDFQDEAFVVDQNLGVDVVCEITNDYILKIFTTYGLGIYDITIPISKYEQGGLFEIKLDDKIGIVFGASFRKIQFNIFGKDSKIEVPFFIGFSFEK